MDAIAGRAGIGKATLYRHFPDRRSLLGALAAEGLVHPAEAALDRREVILQAALRTYGTLGLPATTMEEVAREARVSLAALYRHFPTKDSLTEALLRRFSVLDDVTRLAGPDFAGDDREALYSLALRLLRVAVERAPLVRLVLSTAPAHPEAAREAFRQGPGRVIALLAAYIDRRVGAGVFRPGDAFLRAQGFVSMCVMFGLAASVAGFAPAVPLPAVAGEYADLFYEGLRLRE